MVESHRLPPMRKASMKSDGMKSTSSGKTTVRSTMTPTFGTRVKRAGTKRGGRSR